ncbi:MAG: peptidylprolyl isomerase [Pseudomonadota bacterium]
MKVWLRDPLLLFFALGIALFGLFNALNPQEEVTPISLSDAGLELLLEDYKGVTGKTPDEAMRKTILRDYYRREVLFREGLRQELVRDSGNLREAVIMEMQRRVTGELDQPKPAELVDFYTRHISRYYREANVTFEQYFLKSPPQDPAVLLAALQAGDAPPGNRSINGNNFPAYGESMIAGLYGPKILGQLKTAPLGTWIGPVETLEGWHYFLVTERGEKELQPFHHVSSEVLVDYQSRELNARLEAFVRERSGQYPLELPPSASP